jgi:hypothetical protein
MTNIQFYGSTTQDYNGRQIPGLETKGFLPRNTVYATAQRVLVTCRGCIHHEIDPETDVRINPKIHYAREEETPSIAKVFKLVVECPFARSAECMVSQDLRRQPQA